MFRQLVAENKKPKEKPTMKKPNKEYEDNEANIQRLRTKLGEVKGRGISQWTTAFHTVYPVEEFKGSGEEYRKALSDYTLKRSEQDYASRISLEQNLFKAVARRLTFGHRSGGMK